MRYFGEQLKSPEIYKVTLLGSTGFVGKVLLARLLDAGHEVKVLVRNPDKLGNMAERVTVVKGDFFKHEDIDGVVEGADVVMSTIGPSQTEMSAAFAANCVAGVRHLVTTMEERGPRRLIFMAGAAMPLPGERLNLRRRFVADVIKAIARKAWEGKVTEIREAFESHLDVTVIRPPRITQTSKGSLHVHETSLGGMSVGVGHVAEFMVDELAGKEWMGKAPVVWSQ